MGSSGTDLESQMYTFECADGIVMVARGMVRRLFQEGHIFKLLIHGGGGFRQEPDTPHIKIFKTYDIKRKVLCALVFSLRNNNARCAYRFRLPLERVGGFKFIDRYHRRRSQTRTSTGSQTERPPLVDLTISDDDD